MSQRIALVTGGNRGIGLEVCRRLGRDGLTVVLGARSQEKASDAADRLRREGIEVVGRQLNVADPGSLNRFEVFARREFGRLDVLVNNAAVYFDSEIHNTVASIDLESVRFSMEINLYGPLRLCRTFVPWMIEHDYGRIVNVSTDMAQLLFFGSVGLWVRGSVGPWVCGSFFWGLWALGSVGRRVRGFGPPAEALGEGGFRCLDPGSEQQRLPDS